MDQHSCRERSSWKELFPSSTGQGCLHPADHVCALAGELQFDALVVEKKTSVCVTVVLGIFC